MVNAITSIKRKNRRQRKANAFKNSRPKTNYEKVFPKMTQEEHSEYLGLLACGQWDVRNKTILMGQEAMDRIIDFQNKMISKYST